MNKRGVLYRGGILFTAGTHKGNALSKFLFSIKMHPKAVTFINDKYTHLIPIEEVCDLHAVPFVGLRYGYLDQVVEKIDKEVADVQWAHFGHILTDEAAKRILDCCH